MSFLFTQPQLLTEAATNLSGIGSSLTAANTAAALPTTGVMAAGADEISSAMAGVFGSHARQYQAMSAQAANLHEQFVQAMNNAGNAYAGAESANASPMQGGNGTTPSPVNSQAQGLLGRPPMASRGRPWRRTGVGAGWRSGSAGVRRGRCGRACSGWRIRWRRRAQRQSWRRRGDQRGSARAEASDVRQPRPTPQGGDDVRRGRPGGCG